MTQRIALSHRIESRFSRPVSLSTHWLRLRPAPNTRCRITAYSLNVQNNPHFINWLRDPFENHLGRLDLPEPVSELTIDMEILAELDDINPFDFLTEPDVVRFPFQYPSQLRKELVPYCRIGAVGPRLSDWLENLETRQDNTVKLLGNICAQISNDVPTVLPARPGPVDLEGLMERSQGNAWETAWLLTLSLRRLGLAARFSAGYRIQLADVSARDQVTQHAWSEVFLPGAGWVGLDPASGLFTDAGYLPLASAPEPLRAVPVVGYREACEESTQESLSLQRLIAAPDHWPYQPAQWHDIQALSRHVEDDLRAQKISIAVSRAIGFVSATDEDAPEWKLTAPGPVKQRAAETLMQQLLTRVAPGGILHTGQGESFVGETAPRWQLACFYRRDHVPVWRNPDLLAKHQTHDQAASGRDGHRFAVALAENLGLADAYVVPAYEDSLHDMWQQRALADFAPSAEQLRDPVLRRELASQLSASQSDAAGYALPLRWDSLASRWASGTWTFRRQALYLTPGTAPMGYRLPLRSLPVAADAQIEPEPERCQFEERPLLAEVYGEPGARLTTLKPTEPGVHYADANGNEAKVPSTGLCVEIRDGRLHVFLPPLTHLEHYLDLVATIEHTATGLDLPVVLEGYAPPYDFRLRRLLLEPDAGTLKVWLPESHGWSQHVDELEAVYDTAADMNLRAERELKDGSRIPPGATAELSLSGTRPATSPFLLRPELLSSLIVYWQQHPSLSYFFAGHAIGTGGNAPRVDEGRKDALYELEIALQRVPRGNSVYPWTPDRLLRHLLTDAGGNMRRAEIRIDELYAPDRPGLRLGRTQIRSLETPPQPRLAALQTLLVLALLAMFGRQPRTPRLIQWGADLHDRFMLPRMLWEDLMQVIDDLAHAGYPFQSEWLEPFMAWRFPVLAHTQTGDIGLELRVAHEPWPLLAEETTPAGVARFIDTANARLQVRLTGLTPSRYVLFCNGKAVPLQATGTRGEAVAGIRYKAMNPPSTLHPMLPPTKKLVFDLLDTWTSQVTGGCTYVPRTPRLWGPAVRPRGITRPHAGIPFEQLSSLQIFQTAGNGAGLFLNTGSGKAWTQPPDAFHNPRRPFVLDLTGGNEAS
jgi:uncharacterized protein (DUF2126 family)/transglutaminase-like putative cysteine protease